MTSHFSKAAGFSAALLVGGLLCVLCGVGCDRSSSTAGNSGAPGPSSAAPAVDPNSVPIVFTYGSEKEKWITAVTAEFNASGAKIASGKGVQVQAIPLGSGECIEEILSESRHADVTSPASAAFVQLGNAESRARSGQDLIGPTENLVLSPVVIAMWKPMAEALGWPAKPVGWSDILALSKDPSGWASRGHPEWGPFRFGHTHPEYSNSGLISVLAEVYAAAGKSRGLTADDVTNPNTAQFVGDVERSVVHYGSSTGFFGRKMFSAGPGYLSAAVLYESLVIESTDQHIQPPIVAIYPHEGTFWSDHPVGIVERSWVTPEKKEAAQLYINFLLARPQQEKAMSFGFRPGDPAVLLAPPFDVTHGIDPREPHNVLDVPSADRMHQVIELWKKWKKHANIVLVFDTSGSMNDDNKIGSARIGAQQLVSMLDEEDQLSLLPFSTSLNWTDKGIAMSSGRKHAGDVVGGLIAGGSTRLYDAIDAAHQYLLDHPDPSKISAVIVLTDGEDTDSAMTLATLLQHIHASQEKQGIRVFTIGYGSDARKDVLQKIADESNAKFYEGTPQNIREVFKDIATFF